MKGYVVLAVVVCAVSGDAAASGSGNLDQVKLALELSVPEWRGCAMTPTTFGCDSVEETSFLSVHGRVQNSYAVYLVALDIPSPAGLGGASFGISYSPSIAVFGVAACGDLEFPSETWPASGSGNVIAFDPDIHCPGNAPPSLDPTDPQGEAYAVLGWFYVYAYDDGEFGIVERNSDPPEFTVVDCDGNPFSPAYPEFAGRLGFGAYTGYAPCVQAPSVLVRQTSWGSVKMGLEREH